MMLIFGSQDHLPVHSTPSHVYAGHACSCTVTEDEGCALKGAHTTPSAVAPNNKINTTATLVELI
jgi:hypothetical protein